MVFKRIYASILRRVRWPQKRKHGPICAACPSQAECQRREMPRLVGIPLDSDPPEHYQRIVDVTLDEKTVMRFAVLPPEEHSTENQK